MSSSMQHAFVLLVLFPNADLEYSEIGMFRCCNLRKVFDQ